MEVLALRWHGGACTCPLIRYYYSDEDGHPYFQKFARLKHIVEEWYATKIRLLGETNLDYRKAIIFLDPKTVCDHIQLGVLAESASRDRILPIFNHYNRFSSTRYVHGQTSKEVFPTKKSHVNYVVADTETWEQIAAKTLEALPQVESYVKNAFLGFQIPYVASGRDREYFPDFIARVKARDSRTVNLIIEITGMSKDKQEKRWYVEHRWLPAVNAVRERYGMDEWQFIEIANDIRTIKNQLIEKVQNL
jgi:type III restriction enzyme